MITVATKSGDVVLVTGATHFFQGDVQSLRNAPQLRWTSRFGALFFGAGVARVSPNLRPFLRPWRSAQSGWWTTSVGGGVDISLPPPTVMVVRFIAIDGPSVASPPRTGWRLARRDLIDPIGMAEAAQQFISPGKTSGQALCITGRSADPRQIRMTFCLKHLGVVGSCPPCGRPIMVPSI